MRSWRGSYYNDRYEDKFIKTDYESSTRKLWKTFKIFSYPIPRCVKVGETTGLGESIFKYDPKCASTKAYEELTKEVIKDVEKSIKDIKITTYDDLFKSEEQMKS